MDTFDESSALASQAVAQANDSVGKVSSSITSAEAGVSGVVDQANALIELNESVVRG